MLNKLPKTVKLRPCGARLYRFGIVINYAYLLILSRSAIALGLSVSKKRCNILGSDEALNPVPCDLTGREAIAQLSNTGDRYLTTDEQAALENQRANFERQRSDTAEKQVCDRLVF